MHRMRHRIEEGQEGLVPASNAFSCRHDTPSSRAAIDSDSGFRV
jgi:hypothetical protein